MNQIAMMALCRIDLPDYTVRLCDGGFIIWGAETYRSNDPVFGTIGSVETLNEGVGDEVPALTMTLLPPASSSPAMLSQGAYQNSAVRFWLCEYNQETGAIIGAPDLMWHGMLDQTTMMAGRARREITMSVVATAERLFLTNKGNRLSSTWHKSIWPGETGHDNATGLTVPVAWGTESRPTGGVNTGVGTGNPHKPDWL